MSVYEMFVKSENETFERFIEKILVTKLLFGRFKDELQGTHFQCFFIVENPGK